MDKKNSYIVYCHTLKTDGRKYIGITKNSIRKRWGKDGSKYKGCTFFLHAIQKYGWDAFEHEVLYQNFTQQDAERYEKELIEKYDTRNHSKGFNIREGGGNKSSIDESTKQKLREANLGKKHTDESRKKMSKSQTKRYENPAERYKVANYGNRNGMYGRHRTEEEKDHYRKINTRPNIWQLGVPRSEETKQKLRNVHRSRIIKVVMLDNHNAFDT